MKFIIVLKYEREMYVNILFNNGNFNITYDKSQAHVFSSFEMAWVVANEVKKHSICAALVEELK